MLKDQTLKKTRTLLFPEASRILYAHLVGEKQHKIARASFCTQSCSIVSESLSGFGTDFEIAFEPSKLQKYAETLEKGHFDFLRQTLVCTKTLVQKSCSIVGQLFVRISSPTPHLTGGCRGLP